MNKKTHIVIVVYNRIFNLTHWLKCWDQCDKGDTEVVVIHNFDTEDLRFSELCESHGVQYIRRANVGFDIGAFQDVCKGRLADFPEWERILWLTDDTIPMRHDFVQQFNQAMKKGVGVACMDLSPHVTKHIRTTGFMVDRSTAERLRFPADPITTKWQCYQFEHKSKKNIFYSQVIDMGLRVEMVAPRETSPLWDIGYHRRLPRKAEHEQLFGRYVTHDKVIVICPIFRTFPAIVSSLIMQTHENWRLILIHDGPDTTGVRKKLPDDERITFFSTKKRGGCWGHYIRSVGLQQYQDEGDFVVITNPDNFYTPVFFEYAIRAFQRHPRAVAIYSEKIVHSYTAWKIMDQKLQVGFLDCGGVMLKMKEAAAVGWQDITTHSADWTFFYDVIQRYGAHTFYKIPGVHFVHN